MSAEACSWKRVDLGATLDAVAQGKDLRPVPVLMPRSDGVCLLYSSKVHQVAAEPESMKTWIALWEVSRLLNAGQRVGYVDFEADAQTIVGRLLALGATPEAICDHFVYVRPADRPTQRTLRDLLETFDRCALVVMDGMTEAYALRDLNPNDGCDVAVFMRLPRALARAGAAVVLIDHVVKNAESRGRNATGSQHKLAAVDVSYGLRVIAQPSPAHPGQVAVLPFKDRDGRVRAHTVDGVAAIATFTPRDHGRSLAVALDPPGRRDARGTFRPSVLMERVSMYVETAPGASVRAIRESVKGNNGAKNAALDALLREGYIEVRTAGQKHEHYSVRPYREDSDDEPSVPTVPNGAQSVPEARTVPTVPPVPTPLQGGTGHGARFDGDEANRAPLHRAHAGEPLNALTADVEGEW